jgi:hypothetical protein
MAVPERRDLVARRNAPFAEEWTFTDEAGDPVDFTGASVSMQVRLYGAQAGTALVDLSDGVAALTEGLIADEGVVTVFIDEATLKVLPQGRTGEDVVFEYDLRVDLADRVEEVWSYGSFTLKPGVTDRLFMLIAGAGNYLVAAGKYLVAR